MARFIYSDNKFVLDSGTEVYAHIGLMCPGLGRYEGELYEGSMDAVAVNALIKEHDREQTEYAKSSRALGRFGKRKRVEEDRPQAELFK